jgi:hypothetical protein
MFKKIQNVSFFIAFSLFLAACEVYRLPEPVAQEIVTPVPRLKSPPPPFETQSGNTDFIVVMGILIFIFILVPILLHYRDWRSS